ncbi:hypothetical protein [Streptomyces sp. NPDC060198]|uniref:hypothetical protein n=1 Tax=Streptomyces sp. NPDC060198 TaxID=3347070 RepID=UPI00364C7359
MSRDLKANISPAQSLAPAAQSAAIDGAAVDLANFHRASVLIDTGTATGTTPSFTFEVQESNTTTPGDFTAVPAADLDGAAPVITTANDVATYEIGYRGRKRYLRVVIKTVSGTTPVLPCSALILRGSPRVAPK